MITHFFDHIDVAVLKIEAGSLKVGDTIYVKGATSDFTQKIDSMQIDHADIEEAKAGQSIGLKVKEKVRQHDKVYKA
ncbi:MAG: hypothetical protein KAK00_08100 [Nanoarchaeota archaeon]|nr:hypothetical protein [Nanoarchaeota archaeon]